MIVKVTFKSVEMKEQLNTNPCPVMGVIFQLDKMALVYLLSQIVTPDYKNVCVLTERAQISIRQWV